MNERNYVQIAENVDKGFQTAPKADGELSKAFIAYLKLVYSPEEAGLVQHIPMMPQSKTAEEVAAAAGRDLPDVKSILEQLASKGFINITSKGVYCLPPVPFLFNLHMFYPDVESDDAFRTDEKKTLNRSH